MDPGTRLFNTGCSLGSPWRVLWCGPVPASLTRTHEYQIPGYPLPALLFKGPSRIIIIYIYDNYYRKREGGGWKMMMNIIIIIQLWNCSHLLHMEKWWCYRKKREGGGHRVMIGIIIDENDDDSGRPLTVKRPTSALHCWCCMASPSVLGSTHIPSSSSSSEATLLSCIPCLSPAFTAESPHTYCNNSAATIDNLADSIRWRKCGVSLLNNTKIKLTLSVD